MKHKLSNILVLPSIIPKNAVVKNQDITSKSQRLLLELGFIRPASNGTFHLLPVIQKSIEKLVKLVDECMTSIEGQKLTLPILSSTSLWKKSGRLNGDIAELFIASDRGGKDHILSPTHEESVTSLLASASPISYKRFPLRLYQIGPKFRDELKPRFGLIRAKEFLMKDLYSFDVNQEEAEKSYHEVNDAYINLLNKLEIPWTRVEADSGIMGGTMSHEFHVPATIGEDRIIHCKKCSYKANEEVSRNVVKCPKCGSSELNHSKGIEVAHTFLLGTKYSKPLRATFLQSNGKPEDLIMGSYGIGITRLIAASLEALSTENELRWPTKLAPFTICIIPPKDGSKEQAATEQWTNKIYSALMEFCDEESILLDDRTDLTIGKRFLESKRSGYPIIIVIGSKAANESPKFELFSTNFNLQVELEFNDLLNQIKIVLS